MLLNWNRIRNNEYDVQQLNKDSERWNGQGSDFWPSTVTPTLFRHILFLYLYLFNYIKKNNPILQIFKTLHVSMISKLNKPVHVASQFCFQYNKYILLCHPFYKFSLIFVHLLCFNKYVNCRNRNIPVTTQLQYLFIHFLWIVSICYWLLVS